MLFPDAYCVCVCVYACVCAQAVSSALDQVLTSVGSNVPSPHRHATHDKSQPLSTHATDTAQGAVSAGGSEAAGGAATQSEHDVPKPDPFVTVQSTLPTTHGKRAVALLASHTCKL